MKILGTICALLLLLLAACNLPPNPPVTETLGAPVVTRVADSTLPAPSTASEPPTPVPAIYDAQFEPPSPIPWPYNRHPNATATSTTLPTFTPQPTETQRPPMPRQTATAGEFIRDGELISPLGQNWRVEQEYERQEGPAGRVLQGDENGRPLVAFERAGANHAELGITQDINQTVPAGGWMQFGFTLRIWDHDTDVCGPKGTECPVTVRIIWNSKDGIEHEWSQGFFTEGNPGAGAPSACIGCGMPKPFIRVPIDEWYTYQSPNLLFDLHDRSTANLPHVIRSITIAAAGRSFQAQVSQISLRVGAQRPIVTSPSATATPPSPRHVTVADMVRQPPGPGEDVEIDGYFDLTTQFFFNPAGISNYNPRWGANSRSVFFDTCPTKGAAELTDVPYYPKLGAIFQVDPNPLGTDDAWLLVKIPDQVYTDWEGTAPFHVRLRGHLAGPAYTSCPNAARIFKVERILQILEQQPPLPPVNPNAQPRIIPDFVLWPSYTDPVGYSVSYPPGWQVERRDANTVTFTNPAFPRYPVIVRSHGGDMSTVVTGATMLPIELLTQHEGLIPFYRPHKQLHSALSKREHSVSAFVGGLRGVYELTLVYPMGLGDIQSLLNSYNLMVVELREQGQSTPTLTPTTQAALGPGPFLTRDQAIARALLQQGTTLMILDAHLVSEQEGRALNDDCVPSELHPAGIWTIKTYGLFDQEMKTVTLYLDAKTGAGICQAEGERVTPAPTLTPNAQDTVVLNIYSATVHRLLRIDAPRSGGLSWKTIYIHWQADFVIAPTPPPFRPRDLPYGLPSFLTDLAPEIRFSTELAPLVDWNNNNSLPDAAVWITLSPIQFQGAEPIVTARYMTSRTDTAAFKYHLQMREGKWEVIQATRYP